MDDGNERRAIFVTGAASGMGRATACLFADRGWLVGAADVDLAGLAQLEEKLGSERVWTRRLDVTDKADYDLAIAEFGERSGDRLDLLFNNAGIAHVGWFEDIPYEAARKIVDVNLIGVVNGIYAALPLLKKTPNSLCFTTSSASATYGAPRLAMYTATKFAVKGLTEALSLEFERLGVRCADVLPGLIDTPILNSKNHSGDGPDRIGFGEDGPTEGPFRLMPPESVAECVFEAYGSKRLHWYVPEELELVDKAKGADPEAMRDQMRGSLGRSTGRRPGHGAG